MKLLKNLIPLCALLALPAVSHASAIYYLYTPITGAQPSIDVSSNTVWYGPSLGTPTNPVNNPNFATGITYTSAPSSAFDATFAWDFGGGNFTLKEGTSTTGTISLELWDGGVDGTKVAWVTWTAAEMCAFKATLSDGCQAFANDASHAVPLYFTDDHTKSGTATPYTMVAGHSYLAVITSTAPSGGSTSYFIKNPSVFTIETDTGVQLPPTDPGSVPEPGTWMMMTSGVALVALFGSRRSRRG